VATHPESDVAVLVVDQASVGDRAAGQVAGQVFQDVFGVDRCRNVPEAARRVYVSIGRYLTRKLKLVSRSVVTRRSPCVASASVAR
jgi:hypothetical protein